MYPRLGAEFGCHWVEAHAVRLAHAIAAAFTDFLVDDETHCWLFNDAARTLAALHDDTHC